jgi:hypothetical protein
MAAIMLMLVLPLGVSAAVNQSTSSCSTILANNTAPVVCFAENSDGTGDKLYSTGGSDHFNLAGIEHSLSGTCAGGIISSNNWNDCISYFRVKLPTGWWACLHRNAFDADNYFISKHNHSGSTQTYDGVNLHSLGFGDILSGFKVVRRLDAGNSPCDELVS